MNVMNVFIGTIMGIAVGMVGYYGNDSVAL
jgi:hypothetical protein